MEKPEKSWAQRTVRFLVTKAAVLGLMQLDRYGNQPMTQRFEQYPAAARKPTGCDSWHHLDCQENSQRYGAKFAIRLQFQIVGIKSHAKTRVIVELEPSDVKICRTGVTRTTS